MSSSREAFRLLQLFTVSSSKVECLTYWGAAGRSRAEASGRRDHARILRDADTGDEDEFYVYVGLTTGRVVKYKISVDPRTGRTASKALHSQRVGKKQVDQIVAVGDLKRLFVLCGGCRWPRWQPWGNNF